MELSPSDLVREEKWKARDWVLIVSVLALAGWLRLSYLDPVLSFDEIWHLSTTQGYGSPLTNYAWNVVHHDVPQMTSLDHAAPVWAIWQDMRGVLHPPLFLIVLRLWRELAGDGDFAAHAFSVTWSLVGIAFTFATARLAMNRWAATLCATALACAQTQVYFAQEVRAYAMLIAMGSVCLWLMTKIELSGASRSRILWLAFLTLPLVLTHYFALGATVAIGVFGAIRAGVHRRSFFTMIAGCALFYLVAWMPMALRQVRDFDVGDVMLKIPTRDLAFTILMLAGSPFRLIAERDYQIELLPVFSGVLFLLPWFLLRRFKPLLPWVLWLCLSLGAILVLDLARTTRHAAYIRYLAIATPAVPLLFVGTVWAVRRWLAYVVGVTITFGGLMYLISRNPVILDAQPYPEVASVLSRHIAPGEPIIVFESRQEALWRTPVLIMVAAHEPHIFPRTMAILSKPMTPAMLRELNARSLWLMTGFETSTEFIIPGARRIESFYGDEDLRIDHLEIDVPPLPASEGEGAIPPDAVAPTEPSPVGAAAPSR